MSDPVQEVMNYHEASKHYFERYAKGPGYLDWATQPDPFRRYPGAPIINLRQIPITVSPPYDLAFIEGSVESRPLTLDSVSQLLFDALALSAWKQAGQDAWALRVNPSSGNLHPTEAYLICGPMKGLADAAGVYHYASREHAVELRASFSISMWQRLTTGFPENTIFMGLTSIYWREAWKYGERAYRYCQIDLGHALGALSVSAAGLGWRVRLLDGMGSEDMRKILGVFTTDEAEPEEPDCIIAICPAGEGGTPNRIDADAIQDLAKMTWLGRPNMLSPSHVTWEAIERVAKAVEKPSGCPVYPQSGSTTACSESTAGRAAPLRSIIHQRRSAVAMDGVTFIPRSTFYEILLRVLPGPGRVPFSVIPWPAQVHLILFVHRVDQLPAGLYCLVRNRLHLDELKTSMREEFVWSKPEGCPEALDLYLLAKGNVQKVSMEISCFQDIASDGCFSAGMISSFEQPIESYGAWFYPRLYWECGLIGQVLYLQAEAAGLRGTGIGCFFDDPMHNLLGLAGPFYQDLYHFTIGSPIEDKRISTLPAYTDMQAKTR